MHFRILFSIAQRFCHANFDRRSPSDVANYFKICGRSLDDAYKKTDILGYFVRLIVVGNTRIHVTSKDYVNHCVVEILSC